MGYVVLHQLGFGDFRALTLAGALTAALVVLHDPVSQSAWTSQIPAVAAVLLGASHTRAQVPKLRRIVDEQQAVHEVAVR